MEHFICSMWVNVAGCTNINCTWGLQHITIAWGVQKCFHHCKITHFMLGFLIGQHVLCLKWHHQMLVWHTCDIAGCMWTRLFGKILLVCTGSFFHPRLSRHKNQCHCENVHIIVDATYSAEQQLIQYEGMSCCILSKCDFRFKNMMSEGPRFQLFSTYHWLFVFASNAHAQPLTL